MIDPGISLVTIVTIDVNYQHLNLQLCLLFSGNLLAGFATFAPKFIEAQFSLQSSTAAMYIGKLVVPCV